MANGFHQFVQKCTRGNHILDIVLCNESLTVSNTKVEAPFSNSDHSQVFFNDSDRCERQVNSAIKRYDWSHAIYGDLAAWLASVDWCALLAVNLTVDTIWNAFCDILNAIIDRCVPVI